MRHRESHTVDDTLRRAAERLPVGEPTPHWEALRSELDQALPPGPPPQGQTAAPQDQPVPGPAGWWWRGIGLLTLGTVLSLWWWSSTNAALSRQDTLAPAENTPTMHLPATTSRRESEITETGRPTARTIGPASENPGRNVAGDGAAASAANTLMEDRLPDVILQDSSELPVIQPSASDTLVQPERSGKKKKFLFW